jgi:anaerobic magnesium-protoporphyrin IX monomethyl ester cyclase
LIVSLRLASPRYATGTAGAGVCTDIWWEPHYPGRPGQFMFLVLKQVLPKARKTVPLNIMRTLLTTLNAKYIHTNLAIRILYEQNVADNVFWKEFTIKGDLDKTADECALYDLVAFSCYIWNITQTLVVCEMIKTRNPACCILLGGPEVSYEYDEVITLPYIDYIIAGEGEIPFKLFLEGFPDVKLVPGLVYAHKDQVISNPLAPTFDVKLFEGSMPYRYDDAAELAPKVLYIETSRGCPYKCGFCLASLDNKVRYLPQNCIHNTLKYLMAHGRTIKFLDRTFNMKRDFTIGIFEFILEHHRPGNIFQFEITADILHPDIIEFINKHVPRGLFRFEIGIQTVNQQANLAVKRKQDFEKTKRIIDQVRDKVELHLDLIVGLPLDTMQDIRHSFTEVFKLFAPELQLGFLKFLKGTPMREMAPEHGYVFDSKPPYEIIRSKYLTEEELAGIRFLEQALEVYWNGGRTINTLKYVTATYDIFNFLSELGRYFSSRCNIHRYSLDEVYNIFHDFAKAYYQQDEILPQLIAVDYYSHFKVHPKPAFIKPIAYKPHAHVKGERSITLPLSFDFAIFMKEGRIAAIPSLLRFTYNSVNKAEPTVCKEAVFA